MNKLRIALVHWAIPPTIGGVESYLVDLASGLSRHGYEVALITGERDPERDLFPGIDLRYAWDLDLQPESQNLRGTRLSLIEHISQIAPDVIHAHNLDHFDLSPLKSVSNFNFGGQLLHTCHSLLAKSGENSVLRKWKLLAASEFMAREVGRMYEQPVAIRPLPVDANRFIRQVSGAGDRLRIFHPARMVPEKGQVLTLRLARNLIDIGLDVDVLLSQNLNTLDAKESVHEYGARILAEIDRLQLDDVVEMKPFDYRSIVNGYSASDLVVYPSTFEEPYGLAALEGMASRRPVVASRVGGLPEIIEDGVTGLLVPPADERALVKAVESIVCETDLRNNIVDAADLHVRKSCTTDDHIASLEDLY